MKLVATALMLSLVTATVLVVTPGAMATRCGDALVQENCQLGDGGRCVLWLLGACMVAINATCRLASTECGLP
ncbi:MAG: hypothetical protein QOE90_1181 [Thermoplasmata archaeon]|jgi:hypothetical protein|nr:hypothetical protein [Thermoplasmata archaeon]